MLVETDILWICDESMFVAEYQFDFALLACKCILLDKLSLLLFECSRSFLLHLLCEFFIDLERVFGRWNVSAHWTLDLDLKELLKAFPAKSVFTRESHWLDHDREADVAFDVELIFLFRLCDFLLFQSNLAFFHGLRNCNGFFELWL